MKYSFVMTLLVSASSALPSYMLGQDMGEMERRMLEDAEANLEKRTTYPTTPSFDAAQQLVSVTGVNAFVAPDIANGDMRGPCPGLNAMANHGYIPHNGVATISQFVQGTFAGTF